MAQREERDTGATLRDILRANGEEHLFNAVMELVVDEYEEPVLIFEWKFVREFVEAVAQAQAQAQAQEVPGTPTPLPEPLLSLPEPLTFEAFKQALLQHVKYGPLERLGTSCLPCTIPECDEDKYVSSALGVPVLRLTEMDFRPWTQRIVASANARVVLTANVFVPKEQSDALALAMPKWPNSLWREELNQSGSLQSQ